MPMALIRPQIDWLWIFYWLIAWTTFSFSFSVFFSLSCAVLSLGFEGFVFGGFFHIGGVVARARVQYTVLLALEGGSLLVFFRHGGRENAQTSANQ